MYLFRPVILIFSYNMTISSVFFVNEDDETFLIIVDETKTKIKTRDENEIEINGILVLTTLTRISEAKFGK